MINRITDNTFKLVSKYQPSGDQPQAIEQLVDNIEGGEKAQILMGATGTGKTYTMSQVISKVNKPTLVIAHNKTLAGQLYGEFKEFFPENAVEYFVSYYDYYQPEAYASPAGLGKTGFGAYCDLRARQRQTRRSQRKNKGSL